MVTRDLLYFVQLHKGDISFARSSESKGPSLQLAKLTCDFNLTTSDPSVTPDKFKLQWQNNMPHKLDHELHAVSIRPREDKNPSARYLHAFPRPLLLKGESGEISFAHLTTEDFRNQLVNPESSWIYLHIRPSPVSLETHSPRAQSLASSLQYSSNDVLFEFPSSDRATSRQLWAQSEKLKKASPYFESLLSSEGFTETENKIQPPRIDTSKVDTFEGDTTIEGGPSTEVTKREHGRGYETDVVSSSTMDLDFEDSDMEDDSYPPPTASPPIYRIVVRQVAYRTLFSFLHYLETNNCHFSVLSSLLSDTPSTSRQPSSPLPTCSPKSMYRLSDLYEHQPLRQLAYESIQSQLGSNNALFEYFSDLSLDYPEIKALTLKAVLDNWEAVKESEEMKRLQGELEEGKLEKRKIALLFELYGKLKPC